MAVACMCQLLFHPVYLMCHRCIHLNGKCAFYCYCVYKCICIHCMTRQIKHVINGLIMNNVIPSRVQVTISDVTSALRAVMMQRPHSGGTIHKQEIERQLEKDKQVGLLHWICICVLLLGCCVHLPACSCAAFVQWHSAFRSGFCLVQFASSHLRADEPRGSCCSGQR